MSAAAIQAYNLGKRYRIGAAVRKHDALGEALIHAATAPWRNFRKIRRLSSFGEGESGDTVMWAVRDLSFGLERGEVLGVIGENGAGKSTLLKIICRITEPTLGRVVVRGLVGSLLEVGTGFHPELTGRDNTYLNGAILGMDRAYIKEKFDEIVSFAGVEKFVDTPVKRYSSGMKVRLAFAVAAHLEPEVLIIDEVLAVGDIGFQRKCLGKMRDVAGEGRTVLFVSHNLAAIKSLCSRCLLLHKGRLEMDGSADAVVARYTRHFEDALRSGGRATVEADAKPPVRVLGASGRGFLLHHRNGTGEVTIDCGDPLTVDFDIESPEPMPETTVSITIASTVGDPIVSMSSKVQNVPSAPGPGKRWRVRCDMGRLPLNAGLYSVRVHVGNGTFDMARFSNAFALNVREHDVFGWGKNLPPVRAWGSMYWAPQWDIRPLD